MNNAPPRHPAAENPAPVLSLIGDTPFIPLRFEPEGVSTLTSEGAGEERRLIIRRFGAKLLLFKSAGRYQAGIRKSRAMAAKDRRYFSIRLFPE